MRTPVWTPLAAATALVLSLALGLASCSLQDSRSKSTIDFVDPVEQTEQTEQTDPAE